MHTRFMFCRAILALAASLVIGSVTEPVRAQVRCMSFGEARKAGLFSGLKVRSASIVKQDVESRTGGKVVSFVICLPGPVYRLTVLRPDNSVVTINVPVQ